MNFIYSEVTKCFMLLKAKKLRWGYLNKRPNIRLHNFRAINKTTIGKQKIHSKIIMPIPIKRNISL